ncbi:hypothetical protein ACP275_14G068300 [Erythranthe tilingii]
MTVRMGELGVVGNSGGDVAAAAAAGVERLPLGWRMGPPPDLAEISEERLSAAEEAAEQVMNWVHPTLDSEEKRRDVIDYVQELVKTRLNCEVVSYGSVPLKTYLPDGDIDLTVLKRPNSAAAGTSSLPQDVLALLQEQQQLQNPNFPVRDTNFIDAEVKLVKCNICDTVIDISFNQLGGISTLSFLEQVDRYVGRDHLFKRSIILVKTWCFYESRILGAHHGLLSTYALEALVLYIFNHFHSSFNSPLAALYKFVEYYSQFDWDNYCISLIGPVCKSSLPYIVVERPENGCEYALLCDKFLDYCMELFSAPLKSIDANPKPFQSKHLNIIDPLKENNNLGRSVSRANYFRIRSAFKYGAHRLGEILQRPIETISDEISALFEQTRGRHANQCTSISKRLTVLEFSDGREDDEEEEDSFALESLSDYDDDNYDDMLTTEQYATDFTDEVEISDEKYALAAAAATNSDSYVSSGGRYTSSLSEKYLYQPKGGSSSKSSTENGSLHAQQIDFEREKNVETMNSLSLDFRETCSTSVGGESEYSDSDSDPLADLTGDNDSNLRSLLRGQLTLGFALPSPPVYNFSAHPSLIHHINPREIVRQSMPLRHNEFSHMNHPHQIPGAAPEYHTMYPRVDPPFLGTPFNYDGMPKTRGTGTFFPPVNQYYVDKFPHGRGRNKGPSYHYQDNFHRYGRQNNGVGVYNGGDSNFYGNGRRSFQGRKKSTHWQSPRGNQSNGYISNGSCRVEFGSVGNVGDVGGSSSRVRAGPTLGGPSMKMHHGSSSMSMQERFGRQSIHLKNEKEFPPLCQ